MNIKNALIGGSLLAVIAATGCSSNNTPYRNQANVNGQRFTNSINRVENDIRYGTKNTIGHVDNGIHRGLTNSINKVDNSFRRGLTNSIYSTTNESMYGTGRDFRPEPYNYLKDNTEIGDYYTNHRTYSNRIYNDNISAIPNINTTNRMTYNGINKKINTATNDIIKTANTPDKLAASIRNSFSINKDKDVNNSNVFTGTVKNDYNKAITNNIGNITNHSGTNTSHARKSFLNNLNNTLTEYESYDGMIDSKYDLPRNNGTISHNRITENTDYTGNALVTNLTNSINHTFNDKYTDGLAADRFTRVNDTDYTYVANSSRNKNADTINNSTPEILSTNINTINTVKNTATKNASLTDSALTR